MHKYINTLSFNSWSKLKNILIYSTLKIGQNAQMYLHIEF